MQKTKAQIQTQIGADLASASTITAAELRGVMTNVNDSKNNVFCGGIDCSANPNYPTGEKGDTYYVTVAGKIGGASGRRVGIGDQIIANADNAGGTEAGVGASWYIIKNPFQTLTAVDKTLKPYGTGIIPKASGAGDMFLDYAGFENAMVTEEFDMSAAGNITYSFPAPTLALFHVTRILVITTTASNVNAPGTIDIGITGSNTKYAAAQALTGHTTVGKAANIAVTDCDGVTTLRLAVGTATTFSPNGTHKVRVIFFGIFVERQAPSS